MVFGQLCDSDSLNAGAPVAAAEAAEAAAAVAVAEPSSSPAVVPPPEIRLMPMAVSFVGLCHIISNMLHDVHLSMSWWTDFFAILKHYEALLRSAERRARFRWTLLVGSPHEHFRTLLIRWSCSLYEARWHEVVFFLASFTELLPVFALVWDEAKFNSGFNAAGNQMDEYMSAEAKL